MLESAASGLSSGATEPATETQGTARTYCSSIDVQRSSQHGGEKSPPGLGKIRKAGEKMVTF